MNLPYFEKEKKKKKKFWKTVPSFYLTQFFFETNIKNLKENKAKYQRTMIKLTAEEILAIINSGATELDLKGSL